MNEVPCSTARVCSEFVLEAFFVLLHNSLIGGSALAGGAKYSPLSFFYSRVLERVEGEHVVHTTTAQVSRFLWNAAGIGTC